MKKIIIAFSLMFLPYQAKADLWGGDLPLLAKIVFNTLHTMKELQEQGDNLKDQLNGIKDKINRIKTIAELVKPNTWEKWKNPEEALRRLKTIYHTMPKEYRTEKSDMIEAEISKAMNVISRINGEAGTTFKSGKELERRGADASPGVAQKLTASGVGSLIALEAQSQVIQSHITSLLTQMLAAANEKETRVIVSKGKSFNWLSRNLTSSTGIFSELVSPLRMYQ